MQHDTISTFQFSNHLLESANRVGELKKIIRSYDEQQVSQFKSGAPASELICDRAEFIDRLLIICWKTFLAPFQSRLSLIAAGGYGRKELHPHSDIDILVILDEQDPEIYKSGFQEFFTLLWDIGLKIGTSVSCVDKCVEQAKKDQCSMTRLMETRLIDGSIDLFQEMKEKASPNYIWSSRDFFEAKMIEQQTRHAKYDDTAYKLEPNVKEGPGGLRDIQMIAWVIKRHYNSPTLYELVKYHCLTETEYGEFMEAQRFLWNVRFALHTLIKRPDDRLAFDHQNALAELLGYKQTRENKAVENFMQQYYRTVSRVERLSEMLLQLFREVFLREHKDCKIVPINKHFQSMCDYIEVTHEKVFAESPAALLEIFLFLQQQSTLKGIRSPTIRLIRENLHLIDDQFRSNREIRGLFMEILRQPEGVSHQLRLMNRHGVLGAYFRDFAEIVGRMQYDLFHIYTVDQHSLFVVRNARRFALSNRNNQLPFCNQVFMQIAKPELLYLAALLHDIGKGRGGDHSKIGAQIASLFCKNHGLSGPDIRLVTWLVRNHLIMSMTAQKKDTQDPSVIHEFAATVGNQEYLDYLYLLTVADIRATNPTLWNSWMDSLLKELYMSTHHAFGRGLHNPVELTERIKESQKEARRRLRRLGLPLRDIKKVWRTISESYFERHTAEDSVWHTLAIASHKPSDLPVVLLRPQSQRGTAQVFLYAVDGKFVFSQSTAVLDQLGLTILDARIVTSNDGFVLNSYQVLEQSGAPIRDLHREQTICVRLREAMKNPNVCQIDVDRKPHRTIEQFPTPTQIIYHQDPQNRYTILELIATDRPGLLSKVGRAFDQMGVRLYQAKITTIGSRAEDLFYLTDKTNQPLDSKLVEERLREAIISVVGKK